MPIRLQEINPLMIDDKMANFLCRHKSVYNIPQGATCDMLINQEYLSSYHNKHCYQILDSGTIVGFASVAIDDTVATDGLDGEKEITLGIYEEFQGRGYMKLVLEELLRLHRDSNFALCIIINQDNENWHFMEQTILRVGFKKDISETDVHYYSYTDRA